MAERRAKVVANHRTVTEYWHNEYADCTYTDCGNFVGRFAEM
jgi:hypothetical protein